jgi:hypothetical protein
MAVIRLNGILNIQNKTEDMEYVGIYVSLLAGT